MKIEIDYKCLWEWIRWLSILGAIVALLHFAPMILKILKIE